MLNAWMVMCQGAHNYTQAEMLGLASVKQEDDSVYIYKASISESVRDSSSSEPNTPNNIVRRLSSQGEFASPQMKRTDSIHRLSTSLHR